MYKLDFAKQLMMVNGLSVDGLSGNELSNAKKWVFYPGMLFGNNEKWWTKGFRKTPHEGLDFVLYQNGQGDIFHLDCDTKVPVIADGKIVTICDDFLGQSIFVSHDIYRGNNNKEQLITVYAHLIPYREIKQGAIVKEGGVVASIADTKGKKNSIPSHLHISAMWVSKGVCLNTLTWDIICNSNKIKLIDFMDI